MVLKDFAAQDPFTKSFFEGVNYDHMDRCRLRQYGRKEVMAKREAPVECCALVVQGTMRVYNEFPNGRNYMLDNIGAGAIIGEMETVAGAGCFISTVAAISPCTLVEIPVDVYLRWFEKYQNFSMDAARRVARMMCGSAKIYGQNLVYSSELAFALLLNRLYQEKPPRDGIRVIDETKEILSEKTGFSLRSINRAVAKLKAWNMLTTYKGKIRMDEENYRKLAAYIEKNL